MHIKYSVLNRYFLLENELVKELGLPIKDFQISKSIISKPKEYTWKVTVSSVDDSVEFSVVAPNIEVARRKSSKICCPNLEITSIVRS